ncbi:hypothetical protein Plim_4277 (plasmid) [Planctopirus limnophila DSM 3776]|uniref:Uncharacterized protein n=1 Tax=Planctopirus limnophila (strain ATCC 43296 / DSM 3776 / IFAM 1008 / Mu 290) TaxID=521674 RepID=D5SZG4_PLAL2|nr:hypothetical protein [Planctopirus limnophila]ADG70084.1 hypothetical protein Plim_4277 [Planctopirus limnophila DSM 3776]
MKRLSGCAVVCFLGLVALCIIPAIFAKRGGPATNRVTPQPVGPAKPVDQSDVKVIPGLMPVDIYMNLTKQGFLKQGPVGSPPMWRLTRESDGVKMDVEIFSPGSMSSVSSVRAFCFSPSGVRVDEAGKMQFLFPYLATLPYQGAEPIKAQEWVIEHMKTGGETIIGSVKFEILGADNEFSRSLRISVVE